MTGIRKRITIGFLSIIVLLFFSGLVSLFELSHMSTDIDLILASNRKSIATSEGMLNAIRASDRAVISYAVLRDTSYVDSCRSRFIDLSIKIEQARLETSNSAASLFDSLDASAGRLNGVFEQLRKSRNVENSLRADSLWSGNISFDGTEWYDKEYMPVYDMASDQIIRLLSHAQNSLTPRAERLSRNAYRAVTPVFISLVVMIVILLMFYYFIMIYSIKPIVEMNKSLGDWMRYKLPFAVKAECRDELEELKTKIESVTSNAKLSK
jgi:CHASE3 domain sensor protein